jgi:hypothetical protein
MPRFLLQYSAQYFARLHRRHSLHIIKARRSVLMPGGGKTADLKYGPHRIFEQVASKLIQAVARASDYFSPTCTELFTAASGLQRHNFPQNQIRGK